MKNLLQTHSVSWAQSVKLTLESEGIEAVGPPPPSWRWQKRGLQLLALGLVLMFVTAGLRDRFEAGPFVYASAGVTALAFIGGFLLIALGWRADKQPL